MKTNNKDHNNKSLKLTLSYPNSLMISSISLLEVASEADATEVEVVITNGETWQINSWTLLVNIWVLWEVAKKKTRKKTKKLNKNAGALASKDLSGLKLELFS